MKVNYIHHSAFYVEFDKTVLVFDYYDGKSIEACIYNGSMPEFPKDTQMYVFASHSHRDHFDMEVLRWSCRYEQIHYIFAKEVKKKLGNSALRRIFPDKDEQELRRLKDKIHYVKPQEVLEVAGVEVETFLSTDSGVAFLVTCEGRKIYHAGDLNWWHWAEETEEFNCYQKETYQAQMELLAGRKIDVAFVILDPRQKQDMFLGIDYFMHKVGAEYVIPMHMWKKYEYIGKYKASLEERELAERVIELSGENQQCLEEV